jgi:hypothetical protein
MDRQQGKQRSDAPVEALVGKEGLVVGEASQV